MNTNDRDPLEALLQKNSEAFGTPRANNIPETTPMVETPVMEFPVENTQEPPDIAEDIYGDNDLNNEIQAQNDADEAAKQAIIAERVAEREANKRDVMPPDPMDKAYLKEAIGYQADKLTIVQGMVQQVIQKHKLVGGIPVSTAKDPNLRMHVMGDLIEIYQNTGEEITPAFEKVILDNWAYAETNDTPSEQDIYEPYDEHVASSESNNNDDEVKKEPEAAANITVNVQPNTPVTINVDEELIKTMSKSREINVHVKEISEKDMYSSKVVLNSQATGIISNYDPGLNDVPVTLPYSAYRCIIRPVNWFDVIKLTAPSSGNISDIELQKWSIIYRHIKNPSIGDFTDFEDFLKKTKYDDRETLMWALLAATSDDEEEIQMPCINKKCEYVHLMKYCPRTIIHTDVEAAEKMHYAEIHDASVGADAIELWKNLSDKHRAFKLPNTGIIVEMGRPSAYEYITEKLPLMKMLFERAKPGVRMEEANMEKMMNDPTMIEFSMLTSVAMFVSAVIITKDSVDYRYTKWQDIENVVSNMLDFNDSGILFNMISQERSKNPPIEFYLSDVTCPKCGRHDERLMINDIAGTLLFQLSRRFQNTTVNLIET